MTLYYDSRYVQELYIAASSRVLQTEGRIRSRRVRSFLPISKTEGASPVVVCGVFRYTKRLLARTTFTSCLVTRACAIADFRI